ncbi:MAG TPA: tRNA (adenosine(37)-N6)-dimethylallyltransferase MiaA [Saprospiraceae bacterium]|nr:tRNA (adenosine(37)-N6)-dimethylallyltransferase MiaA [Saprospiraceae bacterium]
MSKKRIIICGPTGIGKSGMAFELARYWNIPIISADSRQIFKHLNIGTAKPSIEILHEIKHYFIDECELDESYSAGRFANECRKVEEQLYQKDDKILICGGTGFYLKAYLEGLDGLPKSEISTREKIELLWKQNGIQALQELLFAVDPETYNTIDLQNPRRLSRALEICLTTGKSVTEAASPKTTNTSTEPNTFSFYLNCDREELYTKINQRTEQMIEEGLYSEFLKYKSYSNTQAMQTVGYKEWIEYENENYSFDETVEKIKQHTRNYAKRQITWFNKFHQGQVIHPEDIQKVIDTVDIDS